MGRQFTYYGLEDDLEEVQRRVIEPMRGHLFLVESRDVKHVLVNVRTLAPRKSGLSSIPLNLVLIRQEDCPQYVEYLPSISASKINAIEVGRCFTDGEIIRAGRFWYETSYFEGHKLVHKPTEFVEWAESIFRKTKAVLHRHEITRNGYKYKEWVGEQAWSEIAHGKLIPV